MKEQLYQLFAQSVSAGPSVYDLVLRAGVSVLLGLAIYLSYRFTHEGTIYFQKFNVNLVVLTVLTATVMTVISNNIALSLGMVGALSIVRFRTALKDPRDTTYVFWAIIGGICAGVGQFVAAGVGTAAAFLVLLALGRVRNDMRVLIVVRAERSSELALEGKLFAYFEGAARQRVKNTTPTSVELMYEVSRGELERAQQKAPRALTDTLYDVGGVLFVNIVAQSDEIGS